MAFHFDREEEVKAGIRRLLEKRLDCSVRRFAECKRSTDAVHSVRKDIKKIRAILSLARPHISRNDYQCEAEALREISGLLSNVRDTQVHLQTLEDLAAHFQIKRDEPSFAACRNLLAKQSKEAGQQFRVAKTDQQVKRLLQKSRARLANLKIRSGEQEWEVLSCGIVETYGRGREKLQLVSKRGSSDEFHEWRKSVKRLWYQMRLISPAWPVMFAAANKELGRLGECLGTDHDLFVLQTIIEAQATSTVSAKQRDYLFQLIVQRQGELREGTLELGEKIYAEKPARYCKRLGDYWETWRGVRQH